MTTDLPTGAVTFLFTDIEGSTRLWEAYPEAMKAALARHDELLRRAVEANHGHVVKTTGDGLHAVFASPADAVTAAVAGQRAVAAEDWGATGGLRVRMGLHTGEAELRSGDYFGPALNRAARLMAVAAGGQSLVSQTTADLVQESLPAGIGLQDLGLHRLKDLVRPQHVYQIVIPGLPADFPPLRSLDSLPHNLPVQLTSFVGRDRQIAEVRRALAATRLLTLTGPGGTGKTRLSLQVAAEVLPEFDNGVWLVELAPLADASYLAAAVAAVFDVREVAGRPLMAVLADFLRARKLLLLLDNCEHLIDACAHLASDLLHACPHLKIMASSREGLGLAGETIYRVPSLTLPDADVRSPESLSQSEAVCLFVERAQAAQSRFALTPANSPAIASIVRRLDGIPLALELAAARVKLLSAEQIAARLDDRFRLLVGGSRTALPRQQTLRALIDWSYDLLPPDECRLLRRLSVFAGGWTLEAAEAVGEGLDVLDLLGQLVNKSLVLADEQGAGVRYRLLETIRQYARDKLLEAGEAEDVRNRHLAHFLGLAEAVEPGLYGRDMIASLDRLEAEQDNLRAAMEWALETDPLGALRLAGALQLFWGRRVSMQEGLAWVRRALAAYQAAAAPPADAGQVCLAARAKAYQGEAALCFGLGDNAAARTAVEASIALARLLSDPFILTLSLAIGASVCGFLGDTTTGRAWADEAYGLARRQGIPYVVGGLAGYQIFAAAIEGKALPLDLVDEMLHIARSAGNPWTLALGLMNAGRLALLVGDYPLALARLEEAHRLCEQLRDRTLANGARSEIGHTLRLSRRFAEAMVVYSETIAAWRDLGQRPAVAHQLECVAFIAAATGHDDRAATLLGAAEALRELIGSAMTPIERREYDANLIRLRAEMDPALLRTAWLQGRSLTMDEAIDLAISRPAA